MASERLAQLVKCPICLCELTHPRALLPCLHTFCLQCLEQLDRTSSSQIRCPQCRMYSTIPRGGLKNLPVNFHLNQIRDISEHLVGLPEDATEVVQPTGAARLCPVHRGKAVRLYCATCNKCVCTRCWSQSHHLHNQRQVSDVVGEKRAKLSSIVERADCHLVDLMSSVDDLGEEITTATITSISEQANNLQQSSDDVTIVEAATTLEQRLLEWESGHLLPLQQTGSELGQSTSRSQCQHLYEFNALHGVADGNTITGIGDKLYIAGTQSIGVYLQDGTCFTTLNTQKWKHVSSIAATPSGNLLVADSGRRKVILMSTEGKSLQVFGNNFFQRISMKEPTGVAVTTGGNYVVTDRERGSMYVFKEDGSVSEWMQKCFRLPSCVAVSDDDTIVVYENGNRVTFLPLTPKSNHSYEAHTSMDVSSVRSLINAGGGKTLYAVHDSVRVMSEGSSNATVTKASDPCALGLHEGRLYVGHRNGTVKVYQYTN